MNDGWFSVELSRKLVWFSFLSLLSLMSIYVDRGRHRILVLSIWTAALAIGVSCLVACVVGFAIGQPNHVLRPLLIVGVVHDGGLWRHVGFNSSLLPGGGTAKDAGSRYLTLDSEAEYLRFFAVSGKRCIFAGITIRHRNSSKPRSPAAPQHRGLRTEFGCAWRGLVSGDASWRVALAAFQAGGLFLG